MKLYGTALVASTILLILFPSPGHCLSSLEASDVANTAQRIFRTTTAALQAPPTPLSITTTTEQILEIGDNDDFESRFTSFVLRRARSSQLNRLLRDDKETYITTATFLSSKIPRSELPNVQDIPHPQSEDIPVVFSADETDYLGRQLVPDCTVPDYQAGENVFEAILLEITRNIYAGQTGMKRNKISGIKGLIEEMQRYMLSEEGADPLKQQEVLLQTLFGLMTPVLPPFYRIFMGWKVPSKEANDPEWLINLGQRLGLEEGKSYGPAFYAPLLTSIVAPYVFGFLVGPARINLRSDGEFGGLVVNKCKFLQESGCKGMCLHSCKLPAQELFEGLGLPLRVSPNFDSQECQWSFGEAAPPVEEDSTWPQGCLNGCGTRKAVAEMRNSGVKSGELANCY
uniref:Beta-carotene isomerase D27-like C-terminal domain-containing protein n=1 Tax=Corethron hystrix TaxID=216773 RepID=A0A7S1B2V9_9STRA|mmetsp:Transcript_10833/g.23801  ORF Transcript_10833/g.23801 Transcript_10833/m.23801 type:complete len:399 (+) Transcript_10833:167-1363(+)|eukprot:CAMPEP_0113314262 /NCGR_PEP_ID=MMETSP0010_2-20120614/10390_1 /TAXON_ID=216773 ORGANISM="Corethron hystrix, Strain 308" /NCGR_SAMPLE_ID=MMETSP0010_2 /ASSEMBLY_ACC=CAM_ASM_000155 /LENGTH=398 /DNA_ID=CAMNT_0000170507 /DNA_START=165 /DNA_END=1361 /DNA_ORIENTATION=+ /assembly_acc=CAM_ASM_000155